LEKTWKSLFGMSLWVCGRWLPGSGFNLKKDSRGQGVEDSSERRGSETP
jgi:hypothetical protein